MQTLKFTKMVAAGNDFVVAEAKKQKLQNPNAFVKNICDRKLGAGADGLLWLENSRKADVRMRVFNADGSEAEMCGNGARCAGLYISQLRKAAKSRVTIETKAGLIDSIVSGNSVKIKLTDPKDIKLDIPLRIAGRLIKVNFINTGVPHAIVFTEGLENMDILFLGRGLRYHKEFSPRGTNVDFVEVISGNSIRVRTYERGVEDETLACGTGSVASALIFAMKSNAAGKVLVHTRSGEVLKVHFKKPDKGFTDIWLEGQSRKVYEGEYYV